MLSTFNSRRGNTDLPALLWILLYFFFFSGVLQLLIMGTEYSGTNGLRDSLLFSLLWVMIVILFPRHTKIIAAVTGLVLWLSSLATLCYYIIYGQEFSQSVLYVIFETNTNEASEYLSQYLNIKIIFATLIYTFVAIFLWSRLRPVYLPRAWRGLFSLLLVFSLFLYPIFRDVFLKDKSFEEASLKLATRMEPAAPWQFVVGYIQYRHQLDSLNSLLEKNNQLPPLKNLMDVSGDKPRTLVLVIGESTQRDHMSLYGYNRETTPELDDLAKNNPNMTIFKNVVTSRPYTIEILQQALTFADEKHPDLYLTKPSLMNMMKQAGYKTFWITNQQTMTERNTMLTVFSRQTDVQYYMNQQRRQGSREYDTNVLAPFKKALSDAAPRKLIIVHLLGTHINYKYRYPENWNKFDGITAGVPSGLSTDQRESYNDYDNANLFNDHVVASLIKDYKNSQPDGFLLYFSDHGEEVYDTPPHNMQGRNEENPTRHMYNIPFILWTSDSWKAEHPRDFTQDVNRKYSSADLIYTWSDLAGLRYDGYHPERSVTNPDFHEVTRWIGNPYKKNSLRDYDLLPYGTSSASQ